MTSTPEWTPVPATFWTKLDSPRWAANASRAAAAGLSPCTVCGRGVAAATGWTVEIIGGGGAIARNDTNPDPEDSAYMGVWDLGPECAKAVPLAFRVRGLAPTSLASLNASNH